MDINIRAAIVEDAKALTELYCETKVQRETLHLPNMQPSIWLERLSNVSTGTYHFVAEVESHVAGHLFFHHNQRPRVSHTATFGIGVSERFHGLGIGSQLLANAIDFSDNWLNVHRIYMGVHVDNQPAIGLYKKFGFHVEGESIDGSFRDGQYVNIYNMARIRQLET